MTRPDPTTLYAVVDATWPAAAKQTVGPWIIRDGQGGGSRVSAATAARPVTPDAIDMAAGAMRALGQTPLFMIRESDTALDQMLDDAGYVIKDPVTMYAAPVDVIATQRPPAVTTFQVWPPLAVQAEVWAQGGIGPGRISVMDRAPHPKTTLLGRLNDRPAGTVYVGIAQGCAMIHALEIAPGHRRQGLAQHLTRAAAFWGRDHGAEYLTLVTTTANAAANTLYASLGMMVVGHYHYRTLKE
ncbi:GNAT family N-acetyltransferase [Yoonia sp.]|uniref:GNAT family N-acetyltransferase n=1 Tax=Yoonia sp. TaxID=2212373 RepID=UPI0025E46FDF|nr:GNAT family N-acetyltransferase [Yoonia sp.]